jgi:hypothetical protein
VRENRSTDLTAELSVTEATAHSAGGKTGATALLGAYDGSGRCRNQYRDVIVQVRQTAIEGRQMPLAASGELSKVGVRHLSMTDHTRNVHLSERLAVGPELVALRAFNRGDDISSSRR